MEFIDRKKLTVEMVKRGVSKKQLANDLCISYQALYNKMAHLTYFSEPEICLLKKKFGKDIFSC